MSCFLPMCRDVNVPMKFPGTIESARSVLDNAVVSELFNRLQAEGDTHIYKRAEDAWMAAAMKHGYMKADEMVFPQNIGIDGHSQEIVRREHR